MASDLLTDVLDRFVVEAPTLNLAPRTIDRYARILRGFARWLDPDDATVEDIDPEMVRQYQAHLHQTDHQPRTIRITLTAIRTFCRWCIRTKRRLDDPTLEVIFPRIPRSVPRALLGAELRTLVAAYEAGKPARRGMSIWQWNRNWRCIMLMLYAGLRLGEVCALDWSAIDLDAQILYVYNGKGDKDRALPIHGELAHALALVPRTDRVGPVIPSRHSSGRTPRPMDEKTAHHIFERWLPSIGVEGITAHRLRHTCATLLRRQHADLKTIQEVLGHESLATTQIYLGPDPERIREAINVLPAWHDLAVPRRLLAVVHSATA